MKKIYSLPLLGVAAALLLGGCDTVEESVMPGDIKGIKLEVNKSGVYLAADEGAQSTFTITGTVSWYIDCEDTRYTFSPAEGKGDATVTVTAQANTGDERTAKFYVRAYNSEGLNIDRDVNITQANVVFQMDSPNFTTYPETGGEQSYEVLTTVNWKYEVTLVAGVDSDLNDFYILPGKEGVGDYYKLTVTFGWKPNYTTSERSVKVTFKPVNDQYNTNIGQEKLPQPFTLTQAAGTFPKNLSLRLGEASETECVGEIGYESAAPIDACGIVLYDSQGNKLREVAAEKTGDLYPQNGPTQVKITGLTEGTTYQAAPYVVSRVEGKRIDGERLTFTTYAEIEAPKMASVTVTPEVDSVSASISFTSGMEVTEVGFRLLTTDDKDVEVCKETPSSAYGGTVVVTSVAALSPATQYVMQPFLTYKDLEGAVKTLWDERQSFTTKHLTPSEDDNNPIEK